ncbi:unnamed protein product [Commensalibacter communis]|uniref:hypothetical protein n=1 Tax=Commensalibacter communis TaxID=2972786 RepID=UPI0022FFB36D|nr:hypothetical protein [Commensalibacter communis]CAI3953278.1 unnamed protein product [Commensalibacter communis]
MTTSTDKPQLFTTTWAEGTQRKFNVPELAVEAEKAHVARASMEQGFPEITMLSAMRGGQPPWGQDHNGILYRITKSLQWIQAGGTATYNYEFCQKINGYPFGAILQSNNEVQTLWFSIGDNNQNDPDNTESPQNNWIKTDFKDLERRLKAVEDHIVVIDDRLNDHDNHLAQVDNRLNNAEDRLNDHDTRLNNAEGRLNDHDTQLGQIEDNISDIYNNKLPAKADLSRVEAVENNISDIYNNKLPAKADLSYVNSTFAPKGTCGIPFQASTMKAAEYRFCNASGYITQNNRSIDFYGDQYMFFGFPSSDNGTTKDVRKDSVITLKYETDNSNITSTFFSANNIYFNGGWIHIQNVLSIEDTLIQMTYTPKEVTWQTSLEAREVNGIRNEDIIDYAIQLHDSAQNKHTTVLRLNHDDYNVYAPAGAFVNGPNADLAEYYQADRPDYEPGTLMCHGFDVEVTVCRSSKQADDFFGVVSTRPGYVMNGDAKDQSNAVLIALNGKIPVKVKGVVKCGDKITVGQDGYGVVSKSKEDVIIGRAKEDKVTKDIGLVSCYVQACL